MNGPKLPKIAQRYKLFEEDCKAIIEKYQKLNKDRPRFIGLLVHFVFRNQVLPVRPPRTIKNSFTSNLRYILDKSEERVCVFLKKGTTRQDYIDNWDNIEPMLNGLSQNNVSLNKRNKQSKFEIKLEIYKYYLRAKHQWNDPKDIISRLYQMDEIDDLLRRLKSKTFHSQDALRKIINSFEKEYSHLEVISKSELNKPLTK